MTVTVLFERYGDAVVAWASRLGGPSIDPEDVAQEVFIVAHRRIGDFRGHASAKTWLYGITLRVVMQLRRKARRRRWFGLHTETDLATPVEPERSPIDQLEQRRLRASVYRVLDAMSEASRTALILAEMEGLSGEEIAALTGQRVATVWVRLHRAREQFGHLARKLIPNEVAELERPEPSELLEVTNRRTR